ESGGAVRTAECLAGRGWSGLALAIIAGGRAGGVGGVAKPLLLVGGRPILERVLELRTLCDQVLLVSSDPRLSAPGSERIDDVLADRGAPGGVHAALLAARQPWVLAVAGDMPFLDGRAVVPLLSARDARLEPAASDLH